MEKLMPKSIYIDKLGEIDAVSFTPSELTHDARFQLVNEILASQGRFQMSYFRNPGSNDTVYKSQDIEAVILHGKKEQLDFKLNAVTAMNDVTEILVYPDYGHSLPSSNN